MLCLKPNEITVTSIDVRSPGIWKRRRISDFSSWTENAEVSSTMSASDFTSVSASRSSWMASSTGRSFAIGCGRRVSE
jgi:hypothetical protein